MDEFKRYRPKSYTVEVQIGPNAGDAITGSVTVSTRPFVLRSVKHAILNDGTTAPTTAPIQDGLYKLDWSISESQRFYVGPPPLALFYGSVTSGIWEKLDPPLEIRETLVISCKVINAWTRANPFTVQICFDGYEAQEQTMGVIERQ